MKTSSLIRKQKPLYLLVSIYPNQCLGATSSEQAVIQANNSSYPRMSESILAGLEEE